MLLWIVLSTVAELANPQPLVTLVEEREAKVFDPSLPVVTTADELHGWLRQMQLDSDSLIGNFRQWRIARGYPQNGDWLSARQNKDVQQGADDTGLPDDNAGLMALAGAGNIRAAAELAKRSVGNNPLEALGWWDQAVVNGSLYAMLRMSDLLLTLGNPALAEFRSDPIWQQALSEINSQTPTPNERALAWALAAVTIGGYAVLNDDHAKRISTLADTLDAAQTERACNMAQDYVLETATARRARGGAVFSTERPLFALSVADAADILPCNVPIVSLVDFSDCLHEEFVGPGERLWRAWFCPSP